MSVEFEVEIVVKAYVTKPDGDEGKGFGEYQAQSFAMEYGLGNLLGAGDYEFVGLTVKRIVVPDEDWEDEDQDEDEQEDGEDEQEDEDQDQDQDEGDEDQEGSQEGSQEDQEDEQDEDEGGDTRDDDGGDGGAQEDEGGDGDTHDIQGTIDNLKNMQQLPESKETIKIAKRVR